QQAEEAERTKAATAEQDRAAIEAHAAAERLLHEREAPTAVRLEQLRQAVALSNQVHAGEQWIAEKTRQSEQRKRELDAFTAQLEQKRQQRSKAIELQAEL